MCGIAGFIDYQRPVSTDILKAMTRRLYHRGPDAFGLRMQGKAALGHSRLSIIDLTTGDQPMGEPGGRWWLTYNGEVYNYIELRAELEARGHVFHTTCDTEVVLHQLMEYGPAGLEAMNGQWAIALWDNREESLLLARDRFGIRPLHYWRGPRGIVFASEIKALMAHPDVPREMDNESLLQVFRYWTCLPGRTVFKGIRELKAGHWAKLTRDGWTEQRWWRLPFGQTPTEMTEDEAADIVREKLRTATSLRLRADVPVGAYVSGGIDSSLLAALIKDENPGMKTFSIRFADQVFDETGYQNQMAEHLGSDHHHITVSGSDIASAFPRLVRHAEKPVLRTAPTPLMLLAEKVRSEGIKVVLTGEGADEVMAGYDLFKDAKIRHWWARRPESRLRPLLLSRLYPTSPLLAKAGRADYLHKYYGRWIDNPADRGFSHRPRWDTIVGVLGNYLSPDLGSALANWEGWDSEYLDGLPVGFDDWGQLDKAQLLEAETLLGGYLLSSQGDRPAMAHSVEGRFPYLDPEFVAAAAKIPWRRRLPVLHEKQALKGAARGVIPDQIMDRPKQPYMAPDAPSFFGDDSPAWVGEMLATERIDGLGLFDSAAVGTLVSKLSRKRRGQIGFRDNMLLVGILSTQYLVHEFLEGGLEPTGDEIFREAVPLGS
ncbi:MAG: asparagine synthase (glutamine-hydrolyzing) [bacterium]|nr:asparagine synthase (glutamine-hydrolyzing) [bacterium]